MKREKLLLDITPDEKSALRATFHHFKNGSALSNRLKAMNTKQRMPIYFDEYEEFEIFLLSALNDKYRYPGKKGKEWESLSRILTKLRASKYK